MSFTAEVIKAYNSIVSASQIYCHWHYGSSYDIHTWCSIMHAFYSRKRLEFKCAWLRFWPIGKLANFLHIRIIRDCEKCDGLFVLSLPSPDQKRQFSVVSSFSVDAMKTYIFLTQTYNIRYIFLNVSNGQMLSWSSRPMWKAWWQVCLDDLCHPQTSHRQRKYHHQNVHHKPGEMYGVAAKHAWKSIASIYVHISHLEYVILTMVYCDAFTCAIFASNKIEMVYVFYYLFTCLSRHN